MTGTRKSSYLTLGPNADELQVTTSATVTPASPPFDDPDADVILRTSDNIDFHVYKVILSYASQFFKTMFTLPSPSGRASDTGDTKSGAEKTAQTQNSSDTLGTQPPVIDVQEKSDVIRLILECCYPIDRPPLHDVQLASQVLEACEKYEFESVERYVRPIFKTFAVEEPLRLYALSCRNSWKEDAELAAKMLLKQQFPFVYVRELSVLSADMYHRLIEYHRACGAAAASAISLVEVARRVLSTSSDAASAYCFFSCREGSCPPARLDEQDPGFQAALAGGPLQEEVRGLARNTRRWFQDFIALCQEKYQSQPDSPVLGEAILVAHRRANPCGRCSTNASAHLTKLVDTYFSMLASESVNKVDVEHSSYPWMMLTQWGIVGQPGFEDVGISLCIVKYESDDLYRLCMNNEERNPHMTGNSSYRK